MQDYFLNINKLLADRQTAAAAAAESQARDIYTREPKQTHTSMSLSSFKVVKRLGK